MAVLPRLTTFPRRSWLTAALLAAGLTAGCASVASTPTPEEFTAAQGRFEDLMPALQNEAAPFLDLNLDTLREESCLRPEIEEQQTQTRWLGKLSGAPTDPRAANTALDAVVAFLETDGWTLTGEVAAPEEDRELYFRKDGLTVTARFERKELVPDSIIIFAKSACVDHPEDHQMLRSPFDPGYGNSSQFYPDGA